MFEPNPILEAHRRLPKKPHRVIMACEHGVDFRQFCFVCDKEDIMGPTVDEVNDDYGTPLPPFPRVCKHGIEETPGMRCRVCLSETPLPLPPVPRLKRHPGDPLAPGAAMEAAPRWRACSHGTRMHQYCSECSQEQTQRRIDEGLRLDDERRVQAEATARFEHYKTSAAPYSVAKEAQPQGRLPSDAKARKGVPIATGCLDYFPRALAAIATLSRIGNDKHNPGEPLHWSRGKSNDHPDCLIRHFMERGTVDTSGAEPVLHSTEMAWRALAILELEIEDRENQAAACEQGG